MSGITLSRVSFSHPGSPPIFRDLELRIDSGWTGVVGPNGAGKTTLLRLIIGELAPDDGHVARPGSGSLRYCPQEVEERSEEIARLAATDDGAARRWRGDLELDPAALERWATLSPGERKRWQIAAALAAEPAVLVLDEPTNHLDRAAVERLVDSLRRYRGLGLLVSHDRNLLDTLPDRIVRVTAGSATTWRGRYEAARTAWEAARRDDEEAHRRMRDEQRSLKTRLGNQRRDARAAERNVSARRRMKGKKDSDARSMAAKGRAAAAAARHSRTTKVTRDALDRVDERLGGIHREKPIGRDFFVGFRAAPKALLARVEEDRVTAGERVCLRDVRVDFERDSRVHLRGPNGAGKTTLLERLRESSRVPADGLLQLPQELGRRARVELVERVRRLPTDERGRVLTILASLGVDPARTLASDEPSPGAARKLLLSFGLGRNVHALLLDEPTNHLDLPSIERLEQALVAYPGALLLVTHDDALARRCTTTRWELRDGRLEVEEG